MHNGFYEELEEMRKEEADDSLDFSFMESEQYFNEEIVADALLEADSLEKTALASVVNNYSLYHFLHGDCNIFAQALADTNGLSIHAIYEPADFDEEGQPYGYHLIHMYCETEDGLFVDVRGCTDDWDEFIAEFVDNGLMENDDYTIFKDFDEFPEEEKTKEEDLWRYRLAKDTIENMYPGYYPAAVVRDCER